MGNRKVPLVTGEIYHIYLRGVEKRKIVLDGADVRRFLLSLKVFNSVIPVGSIYEYSFNRDVNQLGSGTSKLVDIIAYNILPNHYHLLLRQCIDGGISKYMQSFNGGYTKYFNHKYNRVGPLFQGAFQSTHIENEAKLIYISAYINLNHIVHGIEFVSSTSKWKERSSWEQYVSVENREYTVRCNARTVLSLYSDNSEYEKEAEGVAEMIAKERQSEDIEEDEMLRRYLEVELPSSK